MRLTTSIRVRRLPIRPPLWNHRRRRALSVLRRTLRHGRRRAEPTRQPCRGADEGMPLSETIAPHLPYLRRYARALNGTQHSGDAYVVAVLEALVAAPDSFDRSLAIERREVFLRADDAAVRGGLNRSGEERGAGNEDDGNTARSWHRSLP